MNNSFKVNTFCEWFLVLEFESNSNGKSSACSCIADVLHSLKTKYKQRIT